LLKDLFSWLGRFINIGSCSFLIYNDCGRIPDPLWVRMNAAQSFKRSTLFNTSGFMPEEIRIKDSFIFKIY